MSQTRAGAVEELLLTGRPLPQRHVLQPHVQKMGAWVEDWGDPKNITSQAEMWTWPTVHCPHPHSFSQAYLLPPPSLFSLNTNPELPILPLAPCSPSKYGSQYAMRNRALLLTTRFSVSVGLGI